jgi:hypothetical protein
MVCIALLLVTACFQLDGRRTARLATRRGVVDVIQLLKEAVQWVDESNVSDLHCTRLV